MTTPNGDSPSDDTPTDDAPPADTSPPDLDTFIGEPVDDPCQDESTS